MLADVTEEVKVMKLQAQLKRRTIDIAEGIQDQPQPKKFLLMSTDVERSEQFPILLST